MDAPLNASLVRPAGTFGASLLRAGMARSSKEDVGPTISGASMDSAAAPTTALPVPPVAIVAPLCELSESAWGKGKCREHKTL